MVELLELVRSDSTYADFQYFPSHRWLLTLVLRELLVRHAPQWTFATPEEGLAGPTQC